MAVVVGCTNKEENSNDTSSNKATEENRRVAEVKTMTGEYWKS